MKSIAKQCIPIRIARMRFHSLLRYSIHYFGSFQLLLFAVLFAFHHFVYIHPLHLIHLFIFDVVAVVAVVAVVFFIEYLLHVWNHHKSAVLIHQLVLCLFAVFEYILLGLKSEE